MWLEHLVVDALNRLAGPRGIPQARGLTLGRLTDTGAPIVWPTARRPEHLCVVGKTGSGKTHFFLGLADQLMAASEPWVFLDYHGDATDQLVHLAARHADVATRLVVIDPSDADSSPGLNPLELDRADASGAFSRSAELAAILRQRWHVEAFGPRTEELLRNTLYVLAVNGDTLVEAPQLLTSRAFRQRALASVTNADVLDYWLTRFDPLSEPMKAAVREPLLNKITGFLTEPACRHFLGQSHSTINFARAIDEGCWIILTLPKGRLREHAHTLGNLIFARLQFDILARASVAPDARRLFTIFCDEMQNLAENDLSVLLTEGRKFNVSIASGQQHWMQTSPEMRGALLSAATHVFFSVSSADAGVLAPELSVAAKSRYQRELTLLSRGQAVARIGGGGPLTITVPPLPASRIDAEAIARVRRDAVARYARPRAEIEAAIRARRHTAPERTDQFSNPRSDDHPDGQTDW